MNRLDYITDLDYPLDYALLMQAVNDAQNARTVYKDPRYANHNISNWLISKYTNSYIDKICSDFEIKGSPRFYWLLPNTNIPPHIDNDTNCSINFLLSPESAAVNFENTAFYYKQCLLNTKKMHWVQNGNNIRLLFKISIFDETYHDLSNRINYKLKQ